MGGGLVRKLVWCGRKSFRPSESSEVVVPPPLPEGRIRVYVVGKGKERSEVVPCKYFEMEANYLNHPLFENLLRLSEEEFGYSYEGALRIACEIDLFQYLLHLLTTRNPSAHYMQLPDLISKFYTTSHA